MKVDGLMGPTPRMSANLSVGRQTPDTSFGARVQAGVNNVAGAVSSGVGVAAGMIPGSGIVSAAVSSMSTLSSQGVPGSATTPYTGSLPGTGGSVGGGAVSTVGVPSVNTTVGGTGGVGIPGTGTSGNPNYLGGSTGASGTEFNSDMASMFSQQKELLKLQSALQNESQKYQTISNVLKTRHDTAKNAIGNIR
ncbi:hypothetical protein [Hyalangium versicolor]|uniref:hypothetical protein n=1 Tax=Hyalangium versicolor TaxID=2861190 RepID=UPI001CCE4344|nr:hypothetical protein [Hyalangium versicolor]